jgi:alpha-D-ribose 1-methylphosphonate 5-triphosphate diphosphatase
MLDRGVATDELLVTGGRCLVPGEGLVPADILCIGDKIAEVGNAGRVGRPVIDASGCLVLPGIVDIHGDAFERQIMPRPRTIFPLDIAMLETDRQLVANGITTAYHGITVSWEPGLRSLPEAMRIVDAIDRLEGEFHADNRLHIRWETFALDQMPEVVGLFDRVRKPVLALNDHTLPTLAGSRTDIKVRSAAERALIDPATYMSLLEAAAERRDEVPGAIAAMSAAARAHHIPLLSHDDYTAAMRREFRAGGFAIAEFPMNRETLEEAAAAGDDIVLGAPNAVRGGSHNGAVNAREAIAAGLCTILASDYYYPAPLQAALLLAESGILSFGQAWNLISAAPARACGLSDRGAIGPGRRADLVILPEGARRPVAVIAGGLPVYRC